VPQEMATAVAASNTQSLRASIRSKVRLSVLRESEGRRADDEGERAGGDGKGWSWTRGSVRCFRSLESSQVLSRVKRVERSELSLSLAPLFQLMRLVLLRFPRYRCLNKQNTVKINDGVYRAQGTSPSFLHTLSLSR
jgi:hypothetical protein